MDELIPITITIADRSYRIKVAPSDEEMVRKTIRFLNEKVLEFKTNFAGKDMQDYVSMVLAWYATQPQAFVSAQVTSQSMRDDLAQLEAWADKALENAWLHQDCLCL